MRCGCNASIQIHFVLATGRWHVKYFSNDHNHEHLEPRLIGMLPTHRKITEAEIGYINNMRRARISTTQIHGLLYQVKLVVMNMLGLEQGKCTIKLLSKEARYQ